VRSYPGVDGTIGQEEQEMSNYYPEAYVVFAQAKEPLGILNWGGTDYYDGVYSSPEELARDIFRKPHPRAKFRLVSVEAVSDDVYEKARENDISGKYRRV